MSIGKKITFWKLINDTKIQYIEIPQIQRDYVQGRNTAQVRYARKRLLDEIKTSLISGRELDLNFVYGKEETVSVDSGVFIPIDGQQRLTTLLTLHIFAFAKEGMMEQLNILREKFIYRTRTSTQRFLNEITMNLPDCFEMNESSIEEFIRDAEWYSPEWDKDPSVNSFIVMLGEIWNRFNDINDLSERLTDTNCPIAFMSLKITDVGRINDLYIKMNSRGKPLTEFESFKSEMYEFLDGFPSSKLGFDDKDFKKKADNEWLSSIWDLCEKPEKECDIIYMSFVHQIIINRLVAEGHDTTTQEWKNLSNNNGFYNFENYRLYLNNGKALNDLYYTFELWNYLNLYRAGSDDISQLVHNSGKMNYRDQVRLAALTHYAITIPEKQRSVTSWENWKRIINNLINNSQIDNPERYASACRSIYSMPFEAVNDAIYYFSNVAISNVSFFDERQTEEEKLKCKLIQLDLDWLDVFKNVECNEYFDKEVRFALSLSDIENADACENHKMLQKKFQENWRLIDLIFNPNSETKLRIDDNLFRRALLTYGDYSIWANSTYTMFFEGGKGYFNWRRMLRDSSFDIFKLLFDDLKNNAVNTTQEIEQVLADKINSYTDSKSDYLKYALIKNSEAISFMTEKRFRRKDAYCNRNLLYSKARLSADYAEAYSYCVFCALNDTDKAYHYGKGSLDSATTETYIEKVNGKHCKFYYDYDKNSFCDINGQEVLDCSGNAIVSIDDMTTFLNGF